MTINSIRSYYNSPVLNSPAVGGFAQSLQAPASDTSSQGATQASGDGDRGPSRAMQAAMAKLQQIDPQLEQKLETFRNDAQQMLKDGASNADVFKSLKSDFSQLSGQEKTELRSAIHTNHKFQHLDLQPVANFDPTGETDTSDPVNKNDLIDLQPVSLSGNGDLMKNDLIDLQPVTF